MTKISVLMPVYKTPEAYLREAIESILNQSYSDFELLILDDCPDDNREQIVKSYRDKRIKYLQNEKNLGITPSRNKLIALAKGEYLAIFDHDDISLPDRLAKQAAVLDANPDIGVVGCQVEFFQNQSRISKYPQNDQDIKVALMATCALIHPGAMLRKKVLTDNHIGYEQEFSPSEDYRLWCRLIPFTKFYNIPEVLLRYRDHDCNTSKIQKAKMAAATRAIFAQVRSENPVLYNRFLMEATTVYQFNLFGIIPIVTIKIQLMRAKVYLFGALLIASCKWSCKIR